MAVRRGVLTAVVAALALSGGVLTGMQARGGAATSGAAAAAPALEGTRAGGGSFTLRELAGAPAVLVFYRGAYCPLCLRRLESLEAHAAAYERAGARVVAVTADPPDVARATAGQFDGVKIVSVDEATLRRWGVWPEGAASPLPAAFVLDEQGAVLFRHVGRTAAEDASDVTLLGVLRDRLAARRSSGP